MRFIYSWRVVNGAAALLTLAAAAGAQSSRPEQRDRDRERDRTERRPRVFTFGDWDDADRPRLGISTGGGGMRDTLGLLVTGVTTGSPADKAGIQEGDRIAAIDGVNLRLSREDAEEGDMDGVALRRLTRELGKKKVGDEVELRLWSEGKTKTARLKTVSGDDLRDLARDRMRSTREDLEDRAVLGLSLGSTGSRRDTLGLMVMRVTPDGPAEKAGIVEGDRIAAINGVDLRTPKEDLEDGWYGGRSNRLSRELRKLEVGKEAELRVLSGRESRTVRVRPVRAEELAKSDRRRGSYFMFGDGFDGDVVMPPLPPLGPRSLRIGPIEPRAPMPPRVFEFDGGLRGLRDLDGIGLDGGMRFRVSPELRWQIEDRVRDAMERARDAIDRSFDRSDEVRARVREQIDREVRPAIRRARVRATV